MMHFKLTGDDVSDFNAESVDESTTDSTFSYCSGSFKFRPMAKSPILVSF